MIENHKKKRIANNKIQNDLPCLYNWTRNRFIYLSALFLCSCCFLFISYCRWLFCRVMIIYDVVICLCLEYAWRESCSLTLSSFISVVLLGWRNRHFHYSIDSMKSKCWKQYIFIILCTVDHIICSNQNDYS